MRAVCGRPVVSVGALTNLSSFVDQPLSKAAVRGSLRVRSWIAGVHRVARRQGLRHCVPRQHDSGSPAHGEPAAMGNREISNGQNESLKKYAADTLPDVMEHLEMAKQQYSMLTSGSPPTK